MLIVVGIVLCVLLGQRTVDGVEIGPTQSQSQSRSISASQGVCPVQGVVRAFPNGSQYESDDYQCWWIHNAVDNAYNARDGYPCVLPGGLTLAPTKVDLQLSTGGADDRGYDWVKVTISYNYTHYHNLHPRKVISCFNEPIPGPHNPPFLNYIEYGKANSGCDRVCYLIMYYEITCSADYRNAKSGNYYVDIEHIGRVDFNVSVCLNEKFQTDYATGCAQYATECPINSAVYYSESDGESITPLLFTSVITLLALLAVL